jgi:hypothetical protein
MKHRPLVVLTGVVIVTAGCSTMSSRTQMLPPTTSQYTQQYDAEVGRIRKLEQSMGIAPDASAPMTASEYRLRYDAEVSRIRQVSDSYIQTDAGRGRYMPAQVPTWVKGFEWNNHATTLGWTSAKAIRSQNADPVSLSAPSSLPTGSYRTFSSAWQARQAYRAQRNEMLDAVTEQVAQGGNASASVPITSVGRPVYDPNAGRWTVPVTPGFRPDDSLNQPYYGR